MGSREQALIRESPNGETHLRSLLLRRGASMKRGESAQEKLRAGTRRRQAFLEGFAAIFGPTEINRRDLFSESIGE
jgi:hypothetical protein